MIMKIHQLNIDDERQRTSNFELKAQLSHLVFLLFFCCFGAIMLLGIIRANTKATIDESKASYF